MVTQVRAERKRLIGNYTDKIAQPGNLGLQSEFGVKPGHPIDTVDIS